MEPSVVEEVRLTRFKSFRDAVLPLDPLTLIVGRNGSGKSNALDGLWALSRLATGDDVRDALDGGRDGPAVRGGAAGCAPFGESAFAARLHGADGHQTGAGSTWASGSSRRCRWSTSAWPTTTGSSS